MTQTEAKQALKQGKKISHSHFMPSEFVRLDESGTMRDEDDNIFNDILFWNLRTSQEFQTGWEIID